MDASSAVRKRWNAFTRSVALAFAGLAFGGLSAADVLAPDPVIPNAVQLRIDEVVGQAYQPFTPYRVASPVFANGSLHIVDQAGRIFRGTQDAQTGAFTPFDIIYTLDDAPPETNPIGSRAILNISHGVSGTLDVALRSDQLPSGVTSALPLPERPETGTDFYPDRGYLLVYRYQQAVDGSLSNPVLLSAVEAEVSGNHPGGGMLTLADGRVLIATGDHQPFDRDGLFAPQDAGTSPSKLLLIDPSLGSVEVAALGLRNPQQLTLVPGPDGDRLLISDIGARVAEEINSVLLSDILDTRVAENFGWGRSPADGLSREGTFLIDTSLEAVGQAPVPEFGFETPFVQFGREEARFVAVSGPVAAPTAFETLTTVFGDLATGQLYATRAPLDSNLAEVLGVELIDDATGEVTSLFSLAGNNRPDPRFFAWDDGTAGVLLERTGALYRLTEAAVVPLSAGVWFLLAGVAALTAPRWGKRARAA